MAGWGRGRAGILASALAAALAAAGCVSVPREAPALSAEVTARLDALRDAHLGLLRRWADEREARARLFFEKVWIPEFMANLRAEPAFQAKWKEILAETDPARQAEGAATAGLKVQGRIDAEWTAVRDSIRVLETGIERRLREEYARARVASDAVTGLLTTAAQATATRDRALAAVGAAPKVEEMMVRADDALEGLVEFRDRVESGRDRVKGFLATVEEWRREFGR
jgi:hypothetical protein